MSAPSLLDSLDTTVTLEWEATRTIGTLVQLGGRKVVLTALRAPPVGMTVYLRIERETAADAIAIDGSCAAVSDSEWGEHQVDVNLQRVGTTTSAIALREFIETYGIERGGTVSVGRNRDNPDLKRFVYALPDDADATPGPALTAAPTPGPQRVMAPAAVAAPSFVPPMSEEVRATTPETSTTFLQGAAKGFAPFAPKMGAVAAPAVQAPTAAAWSKPDLAPASAPAPPRASMAQQSEPELGTPVGDLDMFSTDDLLSALEDAAGTTARSPGHAAPIVETTMRFGGGAVGRVPPPADDTDATRSFQIAMPHDEDRDDNEEILVHIVDHNIREAAPVASKTDKGLVGRLFGKKSAAHAPVDAHQDEQQRISEPMTAAKLFAGEFAQRLELKVQFEVGPKKRKVDGMLLRLSESKLRVRAQTLPAHYDRITVWVPGRAGPKDILALRCEVTRVHNGDGDPTQATFDAKLSAGGNPPATMIKLRQVMQEAAGEAG